MIKRIAELAAPPALLALARAFYPSSSRYSGPYRDWQTACSNSDGYDQPELINGIAEAARTAVATGQSDRDGTILPTPVTPFGLIGLLLDAHRRDGRLDVLDFGGALGNSFRACQAALPDEVSWHVIEQPSLAVIGAEQFATAQLSFHQAIDESAKLASPNVILLSSVLQYLDHPDDILSALARLPARYLIIERTPFTNAPHHRAAVQHLPRRIARASYPLWLLSRSRIIEQLGEWTIIGTGRSPEGWAVTRSGYPFEFGDIIWARNNG